jgi:asparagine synthase (glutamine-hydrolysing)
MYFHTDYTIQGDVALKMAGIETREPYADLRLITLLLSLSPQQHLRPFPRKFLLREAMQEVLPEQVRTRTGKGRAYRFYFQSVSRYQEQLRRVVAHMPELLRPYLDPLPLLAAIDHVAQGGSVQGVAFSAALALILWAHRLPWADGIFPARDGREGAIQRAASS